MRIITWNCNMALRKKVDLLNSYKPDILVIPECEHLDKFTYMVNSLQPQDRLWFGSNQNKGLGIFSYNGYRIKVHASHWPELKTIIPISVSRPDGKRFTLFAIWAYNPFDPDGTYVTQVWKAIHHYKYLVRRKDTLLVGDFNSNTIWDKPRRIGNHSHVVKLLEKKGIYSAYHRHFNQEQGKEIHPTLYMYRHKDKPYHIDYCFASEDIIRNLHSVQIGNYEYWAKYSDHVPVIVEFNS
jgi:exodeoxyribonuclease III